MFYNKKLELKICDLEKDIRQLREDVRKLIENATIEVPRKIDAQSEYCNEKYNEKLYSRVTLKKIIEKILNELGLNIEIVSKSEKLLFFKKNENCCIIDQEKCDNAKKSVIKEVLND